MDGSQAKIRLSPEDWSPEMAADLGPIVANCDVDWYAAQMAAGQLIGVGIYDGESRVASACWRIEDDEFVLVAGGGKAQFSITETALPVFERLAAKKGCKTIRFHTQRRGLVLKSQKMGWNIGEIVMRKGVNYGR